MTPVIAFVNSKGGSGKTTLAFSLGTYWDREGRHVLFIDTDPQASLITLYGVREVKGNMAAMPVPLNRLAQRVNRERDSNDHDLILIDTPGNLAEIAPAIDLAQLIVIPVQPSGADYFAFRRVFNVCRDQRVLVVPNRLKTSRDTDLSSEAIASLTEGRVQVAKGVVDRVNHRAFTVEGKSIVDVESQWSAGNMEIQALANTIEGIVDVTKRPAQSDESGGDLELRRGRNGAAAEDRPEKRKIEAGSGPRQLFPGLLQDPEGAA